MSTQRLCQQDTVHRGRKISDDVLHPHDSASPIPARVPGHELRTLSAIDSTRALCAIGAEWLGVVAAVVVCQLWFHPVLYLLAVMFIGARQHALAVIGHDATHYRLLPDRNINDWVGNLLCLWPVFISVEGFRKFHAPHHQHTNLEGDGNRELWHTHQDDVLVNEWQYPKSRLGLIAVLFKRGLMITGLWWMTRGLLSSIVVRERPAVIVLRYFWFTGLAVLITLTNTWSVFLLYWLVPYCTWHMVIQYARLICEHSAVHSAAPAYQMTRTTIPTRLESLFVLPRNIGYHIEHHWYPSVPFYRLPELHARLMQIPEFRLNANIKRSVLHSLVECTRANVNRSVNLRPQRTIHLLPRRQDSTGYIVWFTGLSGAGKTTTVRALRDQIEAHREVEILDGDELRSTLCRDLGFSKVDRDSNVARTGYVARLLARHGVAVLVAAISPYRDARRAVRDAAGSEGIPFIEVFVDASLETVVARDTKGLYKLALAGAVAEFTGITAPYEPPEAADVRLRTDSQTVGESVRELLNTLRRYRLE